MFLFFISLTYRTNLPDAVNKNDQSDTSGFASSLPSALLSTPTAASWLRKVDVVLVSNNYWLGDETPCLTYGLRGCAQLAVTVRGPSIDLHSGTHSLCGCCRDVLLNNSFLSITRNGWWGCSRAVSFAFTSSYNSGV